MDFKDLKIGFLGAGNMALAMAKGLEARYKRDTIDMSTRIVACAPSDRNLSHWRSKFGCLTTHNAEDLLKVHKCDIIFICVKPHILTASKNLIPPTPEQPKMVISIAAGVTVEQVKEALDNVSPQVRIYRIMTNLACALGQGICGICKDHDRHYSQTDKDLQEFDRLVIDLCSTFGTVDFVTEGQMDAVVAVGGSGIGFGYTFIQSMADGAVKMGLPRELALRFAAQTLAGSAAMVLNGDGHPIELRDKVCSPGGTTIEGVHALEKAAVSAGIIDAVVAAGLKSRQFSNK